MRSSCTASHLYGRSNFEGLTGFTANAQVMFLRSRCYAITPAQLWPPTGGGNMPVVVSTLNSYSGRAVRGVGLLLSESS